MKSIIIIASIVVISAIAGCAAPTIAPVDLGKTRETSVGPILVDSEGMTLYIYEKDNPGKSNCSGMCAVIWPPAEATGATTPSGDFTLIDRAGGARQWAYKGMPLYGYVLDEKPGDLAGNGVDGVWHVVHP